MEFLDGSVVAPSPTVSSEARVQFVNPTFTTWKLKDKKLLSVMYTSLSEDAVSKVIDSSTSRDTWTTLKVVISSASSQHQLREELLSLHRGASSVEDYGKKFKLFCDQLSPIGRPIEESDKSHWLLRGLGNQFASFADTRMTFTHVPCRRELLYQAKQYDLMLHAMKGSFSQAEFTADRNNTSSHRSNFSSVPNIGGQPNSNQGQNFDRSQNFGRGQHSSSCGNYSGGS